MKVYLQYIIESGGAVKGSTPVPRNDLPEVKKKVVDLMKKLGFPTAQYDFIGSSRSIPADKQSFGDIDVIIQASPGDTDKRESLMTLDKMLSQLGFKTTLNKGFNQTSIGIEYGDGKIAQVDLMVGAKKWAEFTAQQSTKSKFKNKHTLRFRAGIVKAAAAKILGNEKSANKTEWDELHYDGTQGIYLKHKTSMKGGKTMSRPLVLSNELLTSEPNVLIATCMEQFGAKPNERDLDSPEHIVEYINRIPSPQDRKLLRDILHKTIANDELFTEAERSDLAKIIDIIK